mmetsp:Transcript_92448/g.138461  ORF Transcript_92448/g.138461 Transcript_92448/m.138461 type:complete len:91 (-) Transcript_92448:190-462(-)
MMVSCLGKSSKHALKFSDGSTYIRDSSNDDSTVMDGTVKCSVCGEIKKGKNHSTCRPAALKVAGSKESVLSWITSYNVSLVVDSVENASV